MTIPLRLLFLVVFLLRLVLASTVLLFLHAKWSQSPFAAPLGPYSAVASPTSQPIPPLLSEEYMWYALWVFHRSDLGAQLSQATAAVPAWLLVPLSVAALYLSVVRIHTTETLLVLRGLGIQTASSAKTVLGGEGAARFIPTEKIRDVLINEAFRGFEVRYYLVVVVEGEENVVVVFPRLLPGRDIVEKVWRGARGCLYEPGAVNRLDGK
jgi:phosphatidylinositol glycan class H protein